MPEEEHTLFDGNVSFTSVERSASDEGGSRIGLKRKKARGRERNGECRGSARR